MVKILQHYTPNWQPLIDITRPIHQEYADRHGYELHIKEVPEYPVYNGLEKLKQILDVCKQGDIALVMDADAIITNLTVRVEDFLEEGKDLFVSEGLNMGVFIIRMTSWSASLIWCLIESIKSGTNHCEQDGIELLLRLQKVNKIKVVPHPCFNSYLSELYPEVPQPVTEQQGQWVEGSFILHIPAQSLEKRIEILQNVKITR